MGELQPTTENSANVENYTKAQATIDKVLEKVAGIRESEANAELKRQIEELDEAYENAIRLRMLRINTLQAHCDDRDAELVVLRKKAIRHEQTRRLATRAALLGAVLVASAVFRIAFPDAFDAACAGAWNVLHASLGVATQSSIGAAFASCVATLLATKAIAAASA